MYHKEIDLKLDIALGYLYFIDYDHPLATGNSGRVYYHRHIMSLILNRWLTSDEHVHHKDENKLNNNTNNLQVTSNKEHRKLHSSSTEFVNLTCPVCSNNFEVYKSQEFCRVTCSRTCQALNSCKVIISKEDLEPLIWSMSFTKLGKLLGLSDNGVRKKAKSLGCKMPPPFFHNKSEKYKQEQRELNDIN